MGRSHVGRAHLARVIYSSNFDHNAIRKLQNLDKNAIRQEFHKAMAFSNVRNKRSYAQVVQSKSFSNCVKSFKGQVRDSQHESSTRVMGLNPGVNSFIPSSGYSNSMSLLVTGIRDANTGKYSSTPPSCKNSGNTVKASLPVSGRCQSTVKDSTQISYHTDEIALSNKFQVLQDLLLEDEVENACNS